MEAGKADGVRALQMEQDPDLDWDNVPSWWGDGGASTNSSVVDWFQKTSGGRTG